MKLVAIALLVVNVGLFGWAYNRHVEAVTRDALVRPALSEDVPRLVLLREMDSVPEPRQPLVQPVVPGPAAEEVAGAAPSDECVVAGPFEDETARDAFRDWVRTFAAGLSLRTEVVRKRQLFWVYLEPTTDEAARSSLADLRDRGVQDYMLIRRGGLKNAISLGLFSSQDSVNRRLAELSEQGYTPVVVPRFETTDHLWVDVQLAADGIALPDAPASMMGAARLQSRACATLPFAREAIASGFEALDEPGSSPDSAGLP